MLEVDWLVVRVRFLLVVVVGVEFMIKLRLAIAASSGERQAARASGKATFEHDLNPGARPSVLFHIRRPMSRAKHSLRIFALPLSKQGVTGGTTGTGKGRLNTYYHFVTSSPSEADQGNPSLISRVTDKATGIWADWGKAAPGTWKVGT